MDWDLQAIVRGCSSETEAPQPNFPHLCCEQHRDDLLCSTFPEFSETTSVVLDELAELYKPFYPVLNPLSPQTITTSTSSLSIPQEVKPPPQDSQDSPEYKCKRSKKSQNKRASVVKHVRAEGLCDTWAWRKYGQKPIKGSPYPRSYYKCSTSKGCLARKQVERCHLNPEVFMVTYTAEHSHHHHPPRRNKSLSSTTRKNKYLNVVAPKITQNYSPRTPLEDSIEDEIMPSGQSQDLILKKQEYAVESSAGDEAVTSDVLASDDWFRSLDELNGLGQEFALDDCFGGDKFSVYLD